MEPYLANREVIHCNCSQSLKLLVEHNVRYIYGPHDEPFASANVTDQPTDAQSSSTNHFNPDDIPQVWCPCNEENQSSSDEESYGEEQKKPIKCEYSTETDQQFVNEGNAIAFKDEVIDDVIEANRSHTFKEEPEPGNSDTEDEESWQSVVEFFRKIAQTPTYEESLEKWKHLPYKREKKRSWHQVISQKTKNIQKRKFQNTFKKQNLQVPEIKREVKQLFKNENNCVKQEVINNVKIEDQKFTVLKKEEQVDPVDALEEMFRNMSTFGIPSYGTPLTRTQLATKIVEMKEDKEEQTMLLYYYLFELHKSYNFFFRWQIENTLCNILQEQKLRDYELKKLEKQLNRTDESNSWYGFSCL